MFKKTKTNPETGGCERSKKKIAITEAVVGPLNLPIK